MSHLTRTLPVLAVLAWLAGCAYEPVELVDGPEQLASLSVPAAFDRVAAEQGVPRELLLALAWHNTSFAPLENHDEHDHEHAPGYGWLALTDEQVDQAAGLTGLETKRIREDARTNLWAGAALLAAYAGADADPFEPGAVWWPAVTALTELETTWMRHEHALDVFTTIQEGLDVVTDEGHIIAFEGRDLPDLEDIDVEEGPWEEEGDFASASGFPGRARYLPAHSSNYTHSRSSRIRRIVLHTTEGSYAGAIGWFRNPSANVSAHYVVRRSDGQITQMVPDNKTAWHACSSNSDTIGIEHEGRASVASTWTAANLDASARLVGWLARKYDIPVDRSHIVGHGEVQPAHCAYRYDPGPHFPWSAYLKKVRHYKKHGWRANAFKKAKIDIVLPTNGTQVGRPFPMRIKHKHAKKLAVYLGARRVVGGLEANPASPVVRPRGPGWKKLQVRAYNSGVMVGKKTIRVRVRNSVRDVEPRLRRIDGMDFRIQAELDGPAHHVRYWINGRPVRDRFTDRLWARPDDYEFIKRFGSPGTRRLLTARAYREDGRLIGEGWRWIRPTDQPGPVVTIDDMAADELYGQTMRLTADANTRTAFVKYYLGEEMLRDADGNSRAYGPDYDLYVEFDDPGATDITARAFDDALNRRDAVTETVHVPSWTLEVSWVRTGARRYRFDADAPAGTDRVLFYSGTTLLLDTNTGEGFAPGRAFEFVHRFPVTGNTPVSAVARDPVGNVLGSLSWTMDVE